LPAIIRDRSSNSLIAKRCPHESKSKNRSKYASQRHETTKEAMPENSFLSQMKTPMIINDDPNYVENLIKYGQKPNKKPLAPRSQLTLLNKQNNRKRHSQKLTKIPDKVLQSSVSTKLVAENKELNIEQVLSLAQNNDKTSS